MKAILLIFWLSSFSAFAQVRLFHPNQLVDITAAKRAGAQSAYSNYWIYGQVTEVIGQSVVVARLTGERRLFYHPTMELYSVRLRNGEVRWFEPSLADSAYCARFTNGISVGHFLVLPPGKQIFFRSLPVIETVLVLNADKLAPGATVRSCGIPIGKLTVSRRAPLPGFDLGRPYEGELSGQTIKVAAPKGLQTVKLAAPALGASDAKQPPPP